MNKQKIVVPLDNYGRLYIAVLESGLSPMAKLCYGVMWSFGQESWASTSSLQRRMGITSRTTLIKAQAELEAAGWISDKGLTETRNKVWEMVIPKDNQKFKEAVQNMDSDCSLNEQTPVHNMDKKKEGINKESNIDHKTCIAIFSKGYKAKYGTAYTLSFKNHKDLKFLREQDVTIEEFEKKAEAFFLIDEEWVNRAKHNFSCFIHLYNGLGVEQKTKKGGLVL